MNESGPRQLTKEAYIQLTTHTKASDLTDSDREAILNTPMAVKREAMGQSVEYLDTLAPAITALAGKSHNELQSIVENSKDKDEVAAAQMALLEGALNEENGSEK